MSTYEIVAVLRPDLDEEGLGAAIERVHQRITEHGGTVKTSERWGKRKTAYPIKKYRDGYYALTVFDLDAGQVAGLRQTLGLHEDLLRFTVATRHPAPTPAPTHGAAAGPAAASPSAQTGSPAPQSGPTAAPASAATTPAAPQGGQAAAPQGGPGATPPEGSYV